MTEFITRRRALSATAGLGLAAAMPPWAAAQGARGVDEMALGAEDAAVEVIEYASLTCPHCARFHTDVFGKLKENYIEPGQVRFVMRDVYFDRYGLWAAMIARCGGPERYFGITDRLYRKQSEWARKPEPLEAVAEMKAIGRQAGLSDEQMDACLNDQAWAEALVAEYQKNREADGIDSTPTFVINGEKFSNMPYDDFASTLDEMLAS